MFTVKKKKKIPVPAWFGSWSSVWFGENLCGSLGLWRAWLSIPHFEGCGIQAG